MRPEKMFGARQGRLAGWLHIVAVAVGLFVLASGVVAAADLIRFPESASLTPRDWTPDDSGGPAYRLPQPLPETDAWRYRRIFELQAGGNWRGADRLIADLTDPRLLGHVLAQRYLHPAYKTRFEEAKDWLQRFADHADAAAISALAKKKWPKQAGALPEPMFQKEARKAKLRDESDSPYWGRGIKAWLADDMAKAATQFEAMATDRGSSDWERAAGAYWAARAHLRNHEPALVNQWLRVAAEYSRTFYGQLARKRLGLDIELVPSAGGLSAAGAEALLSSKVGQRVLALAQIGQDERAAAELENLPAATDETLREAVIAVGEMLQMPAVAVALAASAETETRVGLDTSAYPIPKWQPKGGFTVDRALLYAIMRQESAFNPKASSSAGAVGLMQLLPSTAGLMAGKPGKFNGAGRKSLFDPVLNLTLGQKYVQHLLEEPEVAGDLIMLCIAYNAGPGNLAKWRAKARATDDPLLFLATLPVRETRVFTERVLANYWIYRQRLGQESPSLDALVAGDWPRYEAQDLNIATK